LGDFGGKLSVGLGDMAKKSYREVSSKQEREQNFDKLKLICNKGPNKLASLARTAILPFISPSKN